MGIRNLEELGPNLQKIVTRLQSNQDLLKLLYYTDKDPLAGEDLTPEQIKNEFFENGSAKIKIPWKEQDLKSQVEALTNIVCEMRKEIKNSRSTSTAIVSKNKFISHGKLYM